MGNLYTFNTDTITLYGVAWCGDCRRARRVLAEMNVQYTEIDIDADPQGEAFVKQVNRGNRSVPTIIFPDGTSLTEPDGATLTAKLTSLQQTA